MHPSNLLFALMKKRNLITKPKNYKILQIKCIVMPILYEDRNNVILQVTTILKNNIITTQFFYYFNFFSFIIIYQFVD